ncbi:MULTISPECIES: DUF692 family multinuclear iron-containing protein [unclassified Rubrivivax]|uniref:MNIO family bufferin maturase n=1 Tax=unclassified Rubrivivax TaxID=2649762 RepID=UPI001E4FD9ED|nr:MULTISPECIES: DUF692 family multinuclear iron-containing protein [unclassified Rubrivivax]MCC9595271.1 DUF692 family protein [Rubrivivax sp. JA1055]MCC9647938.1 DUF692 family protein [Rubrivivax sp. JA1029]
MPARLAGLGFKPQHADALLAGEAVVDFLEVHAENYLVDGGPRLRLLERLRERWPLSVHGVGLSLGGLQPPDAAHLARLAALVRRFEPRWVSEHLAWSAHGGTCFPDLLPLVYDEAALARVAAHVDQLQQALGRQVLIENPSTYLEFEASAIGEGEFLAELVRRTGCALLLDLNNAWVSAVNHGRDAWALVAALPPAAVGEIHLAGCSRQHDAAGAPLLIDDHGSAVADPVWALYRRTLQRLGPVPTLIERDHDVPPLVVLAAELLPVRRALAEAPVAPAVDAGAPRRLAMPATAPADRPQPAIAAALLDPAAPVPPGLRAGNGSDPAARLAVHRHNVDAAWARALADGFPVVRRLVGEAFFDTMALAFARQAPPCGPVLGDWGDGFAAAIAGYGPAQGLPWLAEVARLERARVRAALAADATPLDAAAVQSHLVHPQRLPGARLRLHPSLAALSFEHAALSIWAAHQLDELPATLATDGAEAALVLRDAGDAVLTLAVDRPTAAFCAALAAGRPLGAAAAEAGAGLDLAAALALLLRHGALVGWEPALEAA